MTLTLSSCEALVCDLGMLAPLKNRTEANFAKILILEIILFKYLSFFSFIVNERMYVIMSFILLQYSKISNYMEKIWQLLLCAIYFSAKYAKLLCRR